MEEDYHIKCIPEEIEKVYDSFFKHISSKSDYFVPYIDRRMSNEKWIQGEFIHDLHQLKDKKIIVDYVPEKQYLIPETGRCDIWFKTDHYELWVELESIVTNYGSPGINITNRVDHVINDTEKIKSKKISGIPHVMFVAYPFIKDGSSEKIWNKVHIPRIFSHITLIKNPFKLPINDYYCLVYVGEVK